MSPLPKALHLPPAGRPRWVCPESAQLDLLYWAWGHRQYGQKPIPVSRHPGWHYVLVNRGKPTLLLENDEKDLNAGDFLVIDPDCASGWTDRSDGGGDLLVWIWRTGTRCPDCAAAPGTFREWSVVTRVWQAGAARSTPPRPVGAEGPARPRKGTKPAQAESGRGALRLPADLTRHAHAD